MPDLDTPQTLPHWTERHTVNIEEAAAILGVGRSTAYQGAHDGSLPTVKIKGRFVVPVAALKRMLEMETPQPVDAP